MRRSDARVSALIAIFIAMAVFVRALLLHSTAAADALSPQRLLSGAPLSTLTAAPPSIAPSTAPSQSATSIPHRFLFLFGLWDALPLNFSGCDLSGSSPPPCMHLPQVAPALPASVALQLNAWVARYPTWDLIVVDRVGLDLLVSSHFPALTPILDMLPTGVQRSDVARLLLLSAWGGVYADVDAAPAKGDLEALLDAHPHASALFFEEALLTPSQAEHAALSHAVRSGRPEARQRIANYFIASAPRERCIRTVLEEVVARVRKRPALTPGDADYEVLFTTGPDAVTDAVHGLRGWALDGSDILRSQRLVEESDIESPVRAPSAPHPCAVVPRPLDQRVFSHAAAGTWKGAKS
jgi:hypothetical protein